MEKKLATPLSWPLKWGSPQKLHMRNEAIWPTILDYNKVSETNGYGD